MTAGARVTVAGEGRASVLTGLPVLDHLLGVLAQAARFDLVLELPPGGAETEVAAAGSELGEALAELLADPAAARQGSVTLPQDEALALVALEVSAGRGVYSNVDLTSAHVGGLSSDLVARFLAELAKGAGLTIHVRLLEGSDTQHVLEAIFKALGAALAQACRPPV